MAESFSAIDISPSTYSSWVDVDISSHVSSSATGAIVAIHSTEDVDVGLRKNGSTDTVTQSTYTNFGGDNLWTECGIDSNKMLEIYSGTSDVTFYLIGYYESDATFFTDAVDKSFTTLDTWVDIDISSDTGGDTATAALFHVSGPFGDIGLRKNGSTDTLIDSKLGSKWAFISMPVDSNEIVEAYQGVEFTWRLVGYQTGDAGGITNAIQYTAGGNNTYVDYDLSSDLPSDAAGAYTVQPPSGGSFPSHDFRRNGDTLSKPESINYQKYPFAATDSSQITEGYDRHGFYVVGYAKTAPTPPTAPSNLNLSLQ